MERLRSDENYKELINQEEIIYDKNIFNFIVFLACFPEGIAIDDLYGIEQFELYIFPLKQCLY